MRVPVDSLGVTEMAEKRKLTKEDAEVSGPLAHSCPMCEVRYRIGDEVALSHDGRVAMHWGCFVEAFLPEEDEE